uniref:Testican-3 n=2 Tax=Lygus hesperus TaxID=30085 RepID=A0A0A9YA40_LYGHE
MRVVWITVFALLSLAAVDAKRKRKFEGDFEFAEEDESRNSATPSKSLEKKRWIHDPSSELCQPLNCKKKELCLLENPYTAVCVSKKELHKSGDLVVPKSKLSPEEAAKYSQDQNDDDVFYDSDDEDDEEDPSQDLRTTCNPCPVSKPTFLCGTDNRTYSSLCRMDYHNCIHHTNVKVYCKGFCPCKEGDSHLRKKQKQEAERMTNLMNKYKATALQEAAKSKDTMTNSIDKYTFTPQDFSYDNKHYKYIKYTKHESNKPLKPATNPPYFEDKENIRGDNEVIEKGPMTRIKATDCPPAALQAMGDRLLDWFSVIMADSKRRQTHTRSKAVTRFPTGCKNEVRWMFHHLDSDSDSKLTLQELYDLEHDQNERCIKPFLDDCDFNRDIFVTPHEWCKCFDKTDRPCAAVKRRIPSNMLGVYVPECDSEGYYYHTQCHIFSGLCVGASTNTVLSCPTLAPEENQTANHSLVRAKGTTPTSSAMMMMTTKMTMIQIKTSKAALTNL